MFFQDDKKKAQILEGQAEHLRSNWIMDKCTWYSNIHDNFHVVHRGMFVMHVADG